MPPEDLDLQVEDTPVVEAPAEKILGRYETVDELTKAHEHLDLRFSKQGTELGEERRAREAAEARAAELEGLVAQQQPQQQQYGPIDQNPLVQYAQDKLMEGDIGPFLNLTADIARAQATEIAGQQPKPEAPATPQDFDQLAFNAEQQVLQRHGQAYVDLRDKVSQKLEEDPSLVTGPSFKELERGIDMAFKLVQRDQLLKSQTQAAQQEEERQKSLEMKRAAQTATGAGPRPVPKSEQEQTWDAIKNAPKGGFSTA